jgi:hypothetical protein
MNFHARAKAMVDGLSLTVKAVLPVALISLLLDMCKAIDQLQEKEK